MNTYVAIVFSSEDKAHEALRKLWYLDEEGSLTVHGAAVMRRDEMGHIRVGELNSAFGTRTAIGVGIGALLGLLAGPFGIAAGAAGATVASIAATTGVGALTGAAIGAAADIVTEDNRDEAAFKSSFTLGLGQSAVVAEISEDWTKVLDDAMKALGGTIHRRPDNAFADAAFGQSYYGTSLYPYYYEPRYF
jgi:uncharacterized membrane protein